MLHERDSSEVGFDIRRVWMPLNGEGVSKIGRG